VADRCRSCGEPVVWAISLRGKRSPLDARPDAMRGTMLLAAADGEHGTRMAIHVSHLAEEARNAAQHQGLRLYTSHFATCRFAERHRKAAA
jgi:hypothetical protein